MSVFEADKPGEVEAGEGHSEVITENMLESTFPERIGEGEATGPDMLEGMMPQRPDGASEKDEAADANMLEGTLLERRIDEAADVNMLEGTLLQRRMDESPGGEEVSRMNKLEGTFPKEASDRDDASPATRATAVPAEQNLADSLEAMHAAFRASLMYATQRLSCGMLLSSSLLVRQVRYRTGV